MPKAQEIRPAPLWLKFTTAALIFFALIGAAADLDPHPRASISEIHRYFNGSDQLRVYCARRDPGKEAARKFFSENLSAPSADFQIIYLSCPRRADLSELRAAERFVDAVSSMPPGFDYGYFAVDGEAQFESSK